DKDVATAVRGLSVEIKGKKARLSASKGLVTVPPKEAEEDWHKYLSRRSANVEEASSEVDEVITKLRKVLGYVDRRHKKRDKRTEKKAEGAAAEVKQEPTGGATDGERTEAGKEGAAGDGDVDMVGDSSAEGTHAPDGEGEGEREGEGEGEREGEGEGEVAVKVEEGEVVVKLEPPSRPVAEADEGEIEGEGEAEGEVVVKMEPGLATHSDGPIDQTEGQAEDGDVQMQ
ncbi:hypothetical protein KIPB_005095, partial [Kipferlia bialata]